MQKQRSREMILLSLFLLLIVGWLGGNSIADLLYGDIRQKENTAQSLRETVNELEMTSNRVEHAHRTLMWLEE